MPCNDSSYSEMPFLGCARENAEILGAVREVAAEVLLSGELVQGPWVARFEKEVAARVGRAHAVAVGSGTDGLYFALRALGVRPGDEVITTDFSFIASASCILRTDARPIFVDVGADWNLDLERAEAAVNSRTKAMVFVQLFGGMTDPAAIEAFAARHSLLVLEDACQGFGAHFGNRPAGNVGQIGVLSFAPTKVLSAPGAGGAVVTDDAELAARIRLLRYHGKQNGKVVELGCNSQLSSLAAAVLLLKLDRLEVWNARRSRIAEFYDTALDEAGVERPVWDAAVRHVRHKYPILSARRSALRAHLAARGIPTVVHYTTPFHRECLFASSGGQDIDYPRASTVAASTVSLPIHAHLTDAEVERIESALRSFPFQ